MKILTFIIAILTLTGCQSPSPQTAGIEIGDPGKKMIRRSDSPFYLVASKGDQEKLVGIYLTINDREVNENYHNRVVIIEGRLKKEDEKVFASWELEQGDFPRKLKFFLNKNTALSSARPYLMVYWFFEGKKGLQKYGEKKVELIQNGKFLEKINVW